MGDLVHDHQLREHDRHGDPGSDSGDGRASNHATHFSSTLQSHSPPRSSPSLTLAPPPDAAHHIRSETLSTQEALLPDLQMLLAASQVTKLRSKFNFIKPNQVTATLKLKKSPVSSFASGFLSKRQKRVKSESDLARRNREEANSTDRGSWGAAASAFVGCREVASSENGLSFRSVSDSGPKKMESPKGSRKACTPTGKRGTLKAVDGGEKKESDAELAHVRCYSDSFQDYIQTDYSDGETNGHEWIVLCPSLAISSSTPAPCLQSSDSTDSSSLQASRSPPEERNSPQNCPRLMETHPSNVDDNVTILDPPEISSRITGTLTAGSSAVSPVQNQLPFTFRPFVCAPNISSGDSDASSNHELCRIKKELDATRCRLAQAESERQNLHAHLQEMKQALEHKGDLYRRLETALRDSRLENAGLAETIGSMQRLYPNVPVPRPQTFRGAESPGGRTYKFSGDGRRSFAELTGDSGPCALFEGKKSVRSKACSDAQNTDSVLPASVQSHGGMARPAPKLVDKKASSTQTVTLMDSLFHQAAASIKDFKLMRAANEAMYQQMIKNRGVYHRELTKRGSIVRSLEAKIASLEAEARRATDAAAAVATAAAEAAASVQQKVRETLPMSGTASGQAAPVEPPPWHVLSLKTKRLEQQPLAGPHKRAPTTARTDSGIENVPYTRATPVRKSEGASSPSLDRIATTDSSDDGNSWSVIIDMYHY